MYKLGQVTGVKKALQTYKIGEMSTDMVLCVSDMHMDVQILSLSEDDFEEDECEYLRHLANEGLFRRPTVVELEKKIKSVHADIMNHWIDKEIVKLQKLIDRANEKGWRREYPFESIVNIERLRTSEERQRLLREIPPVVADTCPIEPNTDTPHNSLEEKKECKPIEATQVSATSIDPSF
ncbi:hypothetical protein OPV22_004963 [Ensete ventricosum]|uniref:Plus3 domain-containing protein n=1 Tax=Ensete ventricosum TaxID=4639 RepID=A0AAV8RHU0_ENSVE|nr:hypothetical protein OPV22_004963 [Ensete ventricosum]